LFANSSWQLITKLGQWQASSAKCCTWYAYNHTPQSIIVNKTVWSKVHSTHTKDYYQSTNTADTFIHPKIPVIPTMISPQSIITNKHEPIMTTIAHKSWQATLCSTIVTHTNHITGSPLQLYVIGKIAPRGQAFQWELYQDTSLVMSQVSPAPKISNISLQHVHIIGIISCITTAQTLGLRNPMSISVSNTTCQFIKRKNHNLLDNIMTYLTHLRRTTECTFMINNNSTFHSDANLQAASKTHLTPITFPTSLITIYINHSAILSCLHETIWIAQHTIPVNQYLQTKYNWSPNTIDLIDWPLHATILANTQQRRIFLLKYTLQWLPVASHRSMTPNHPTCMRCNICNKTQHHWYECGHDDIFNQQCHLDTISVLQNSGLHPSLQTLVLRATSCVADPFTQEASLVAHHQQMIGWDQFLRGRIAKTWVTTQNQLTNQTDGHKTLNKILQHIFNIMYKKWIRRITAIHGNDTMINERKFQTFLVPRMDYLLDKKRLLPAQDQQILDFDRTDFLNQPHTTVEKWLDTNKIFLLQAIDREHTRQKEGNNSITKYF
jgi:hypothetical protein